jgi:outer membrane protein OmpA-like peptidoglycan-associated protein
MLFHFSVLFLSICRAFLLFMCLLCLSFPLSAQTGKIDLSTYPKKAVAAYDAAEKHYLEGNQELARKELQKALKISDHFIEAWLLYGDVLRESGLDDLALSAYVKAIEIDSSFFPPASYFAASILLSTGQYADAERYLLQFLRFDRIRPELQLQALGKLSSARFAMQALAHPNADSLFLLPGTINTTADEYANSVRYDNRRLMFTRRYASENDSSYEVLNESFFYSDLSEEGWGESEKLFSGRDFENEVGAMSFSADGESVYFASCGMAKGVGSCDLYVSHLRKGVWSEPKNLGLHVNSISWDSQPCISADGSELFFVSRRKNGIGESDIWKCFRLPDGSWSDAVNLGDKINSSGSEMAPYLHADGKSLYFSSTGHPGMGGADLFISRLDESGRWSVPENLAYPINTLDYELNILFNSKGDEAFITSSRKTGNGGFDIYSVKADPVHRPAAVAYLRLKVTDAGSQKPLEALCTITNLQASEDKMTGTSNAEDGTFLGLLPAGSSYSLLVSCEGYCLYTAHFELVSGTETEPFHLEASLQPIEKGSTLVLRNVFFEVDQAVLLPESFPELDQLAIFMKDNPKLVIELGGHTDNSGSDEHNLILSLQRAEVVCKYLIAKGIEQNRLIPKGYGSTNPVAENAEEEGRKQNRRTEMKILNN